MSCNLKRLFFLVFTAILLNFALTLSVSSQTENKARMHIESVTQSKVDISPMSFSVCHQYGCKEIQNVSIEQDLWNQLSEDFALKIHTSQQERAYIAEYIGRMESIVGRLTNTQYDHPGTFLLFLNPGKASGNQMDCIDESINSFSYIKLLENDGKLYFHNLVGLVTRGGIAAGYPHTAVLITEKGTNEKYVVDSWFLANGRPAAVVPYKLWKAGWKPK